MRTIYVIDGIEVVELPIGTPFEVVRTTVTEERDPWDSRIYVTVIRYYLERSMY